MELNASQFAKLTGVSRQAISKAKNQNRILQNKNRKIDLREQININFLYSHGKTKTDIENYILGKSEKDNKNNKKIKIKSEQKPEIKKKIEKKVIEVEKSNLSDFENISGLPEYLMNMTLKELVLKHGGPMMLKNYVEILNKLMQAYERDQKIKIMRLEFIEKNFVISKLFVFLNTLIKQIFNLPSSKVDEIINLCIKKKYKARNEIKNILKTELEKLIKDTKKFINKELKKLLSKFNKEKILNE